MPQYSLHINGKFRKAIADPEQQEKRMRRLPITVERLQNALGLFAMSILLTLLFAATPMSGQAERRVTKLADGVYAIEHRGGSSPSGNTTVIIGERQVFVVDSCFLPSLAREDIAQIRQWTDKPVGYLLNTHFHNDHNNGNKTYLDAFPSLAIIAQEETKKDMDLIQPGNIERMPEQLAATIAAFKQGKLQNGRELTEDEKKQVQELLPGMERREAEFRTHGLPVSHSHLYR